MNSKSKFVWLDRDLDPQEAAALQGFSLYGLIRLQDQRGFIRMDPPLDRFLVTQMLMERVRAESSLSLIRFLPGRWQ